MSTPPASCIHASDGAMPRHRQCALGLFGGQPHPAVCRHCPQRNQVHGPGDLVARLTRSLGIPPCAPCKHRQAQLNAWWAGR
jgi:hypothetical protein